MLNPIAIAAAVISIVALIAAIGIALVARRWWTTTFAAAILVSFVVLLSELPSASPSPVLVPVYVVVLAISMMLLSITTVCGSNASSASRGAGNMGSVGIIIIAYALAMIMFMPLIYSLYRMFLGVAAVFTLGILFGGTLTGLYSFMSRDSVVSKRRYGSQTASHLLYYLSTAALATASTNCTNFDDFTSLINVGVLASSVATVGVLVESNVWKATSVSSSAS